MAKEVVVKVKGAKAYRVTWNIAATRCFNVGVDNQAGTPKYRFNATKIWGSMPRRWHGLKVIDETTTCLVGVNRIPIGVIVIAEFPHRLAAIINPNDYCDSVWREVRKHGR